MLKKAILLTALVTSLTIATYSAKAEDSSDAELTALLATPTSDLSQLSGDDLEKAAELDGQAYVSSHRQKSYGLANYGIGEAHAYKHHLHGSAVGTYRLHFFQALQAFSSND